jgi:hypothetical protein
MEATLGISLHSYLYLKLAKMQFFLLYLMFSLQNLQNKGAEQVLPESGRGVGEGKGGKGGPNNVYTYE